MKIIKPEYTPKEEKEQIYSINRDENNQLYCERRTIKEELIDDNTIVPDKGDIYEEYFETEEATPLLDVLMQQTIDENKIKVEFTLTKRQYGLWEKKGGERWLKRMLIGQKKK